MSKSLSVQRVLALAKGREKEYDWLKAAELYEQALGTLGKKDFEKGEIRERIGFCCHRAAMQAESREEFKERMQRAIEVYEDAGRIFEEMIDEQKAAWMFRCEAVAKYLGYWVTSDASEKRRLLDECLELEEKALTAFWKWGNMLEYGRTYSELPLVLFLRGFLEWDLQTLKSILERGLEWGEKAVAALSELDNSYEMARAYFTLSTCLTFVAWNDTLGLRIVEPEEMDKNRSKAASYLSKAVDLSEKVGDAFLSGLSHLWLGSNVEEEEERIRHHEKALECGKRTRDNFLIGACLDLVAFYTYWNSGAIEDPDQRWKQVDDAMGFYDKAQHYCSIISFMPPKGAFISQPTGHAEDHFERAKYQETDPKKRLELLEKAEKEGRKALKLAVDSDIPRVVTSGFWVLGKILAERARIDPDSTEKRSRLEKALEYLEKATEIIEQLEPFHFWDQGVGWNYLAGIKAELADTEPDLDSKMRLLEEAVSGKEKCLNLCNKSLPYEDKRMLASALAGLQGFQDGYATMLTRVYDFTDKPEHLRKAIEISQNAIESAEKLGMNSLMAESYWKIAKAHGILGEHLEAAENFEHASESYLKAAEKILELKDFYRDHASYMEAWNEIEKARHYHAGQEYGQARKHYQKAANLHKSSKPWKYLAYNYLAWAQLEHGEDLSRHEQSQEAKQAFQKAAELFREAESALQVELDKIKSADERDLAKRLIKASGIREEYCRGRTALEEAKTLDRQGDHSASSGKYALTTKIFQKVADTLEHESDRQELRPIICLCRAWQMMTRAEAEASPSLYLEASQLFEEAKEQSFNEQAKILALGHSCFCKALAAGTRFEATRDTELHSAATQHLASAADYYVKAGFKTASEYAKGTQRLFDAYVYMNNAKKEIDPEKKTRYYMTAERVLQTSADSYMKAKHPEKSEEVQRLLESVKEERKLAMSLTEVLHAPTTASSTTSFSTPTATQERAVGLERFEHTNVQAHLTASEEATVGEELEVRLDLVNVAKNFGLLVRADNLAPPSFKVTTLPSQYHIENGSIDMKGKRLEPLKVESIKLSLQAVEAGVIELSPQVVYVNEVGKFGTCKPEPVTITVHPKLAFEFKTSVAQRVFDFLTSSFVEDYMRRRISLEKSGWRTLMEIVKHGKVSKSSAYGTGGRRGPAITELERRGLVETRVFPGERGRGGRILKMRISYDKETIKRHIDQRIMKIKEK